jgi:hypothetical protein
MKRMVKALGLAASVVAILAFIHQLEVRQPHLTYVKGSGKYANGNTVVTIKCDSDSTAAITRLRFRITDPSVLDYIASSHPKPREVELYGAENSHDDFYFRNGYWMPDGSYEFEAGNVSHHVSPDDPTDFVFAIINPLWAGQLWLGELIVEYDSPKSPLKMHVRIKARKQ